MKMVKTGSKIWRSERSNVALIYITSRAFAQYISYTNKKNCSLWMCIIDTTCVWVSCCVMFAGLVMSCVYASVHFHYAVPVQTSAFRLQPDLLILLRLWHIAITHKLPTFVFILNFSEEIFWRWLFHGICMHCIRLRAIIMVARSNVLLRFTEFELFMVVPL